MGLGPTLTISFKGPIFKYSHILLGHQYMDYDLGTIQPLTSNLKILLRILRGFPGLVLHFVFAILLPNKGFWNWHGCFLYSSFSMSTLLTCGRFSSMLLVLFCIVEYLASFSVSTYQMPVAPPCNYANLNRFQTLPNVPWGAKYPPV